MQADSHLDGNTDPGLYRRTVEAALADRPDLHIDLGDTFMVDKHSSRESAAAQYLAQRYRLGLIGRSAPVFLAVGNHDGADGFKQHRPGWDEPIHALLVRNRVTAVFHGHDHLYARQELDGVTYQALPQPGCPNADQQRQAEEYGYTHGRVVGGSGYLRVKVAEADATVSFVRTSAPSGRDGPSARSEVADEYRLGRSR